MFKRMHIKGKRSPEIYTSIECVWKYGGDRWKLEMHSLMEVKRKS